MHALRTTSFEVLRQLLAGQPTSAAKVLFAWRIAAGPGLDRATRVSWQGDGALRVRAESPEWRHEVRRAKPVVQQRLEGLLGPGVVDAIIVED